MAGFAMCSIHPTGLTQSFVKRRSVDPGEGFATVFELLGMHDAEFA
jgi:hypothetical protein